MVRISASDPYRHKWSVPLATCTLPLSQGTAGCVVTARCIDVDCSKLFSAYLTLLQIAGYALINTSKPNICTAGRGSIMEYWRLGL